VKSLSLLPKSPSQSPPIDSRSGGLGVCTHSLDDMTPSLAVQRVSAGLEKAVVHTPGCNLCVESGRNVVASFACTVVVAAAVAVAAAAVVADDDGAAAAVGEDEGGVRVACVSERSPAPVHSEARWQAQVHGLVRSPSVHFVASNTHDSVSPTGDNMVAGPSCTVHSVLSPIQASGGKSALRSHLPRMVEFHFPVDESGFGVL
jgi:hypothetical protein